MMHKSEDRLHIHWTRDVIRREEPSAITNLKSHMLNPGAQLFIDCAREIVGTMVKVKQRGAGDERGVLVVAVAEKYFHR